MDGILDSNGLVVIVVVQSLSCARLFATLWTAACQASLSFTISLSLLKLMPIESTPCIRWSEYWSFSFSISPSNEYSWLISFRIYWFDLLAVQGTFKSLLQHHSSKASVLQCSAFLIVQLSHLYMTTGKTINLTIWTFVGKVMSLLLNMLSRFPKHANNYYMKYQHMYFATGSVQR